MGRIRKTAVTPPPTPTPQVIVRNQQPQANKVEEKKTSEHYKYNAKKVNWQYDGQHRTTTVVYVGNLPNHIKVAAVQYFVIKKAKKTKESWQKRVFLKFNRTFKYYPSEEAMYCDPSRRNALFLRNFDILDKDCHKNLTRALMQYGDLAKDIVIRVDGFGDPYCIVTFKYIDD